MTQKPIKTQIQSLIKSERGGALIMTMITIVIIMLFVTMLMSETLTTRKQALKTGHNIDAGLVSEMGIDYYEAYLSGKVTDINVIDESVFVPIVFTIDMSRSFRIENITYELIDDQYIIDFESVGISHDTEVITEGQVIIR